MTESIRLLLIVGSLVALAQTSCLAADQSPVTQPAIEIFRKNINDGTSIVVTRSKMSEPDGLRPMPSRWHPDLIKNAYVLTVVLHRARASTIVLASRLQLDVGDKITGCDVLDVVVTSRGLILPVTVGDELGLWKIEPDTMSTDSWTWLNGWQAAQLSQRLDKTNVRVDISRLPDERLEVTVTDMCVIEKPQTLFQQDGNDWRFKITKSWEEDMSDRLKAQKMRNSAQREPGGTK